MQPKPVVKSNAPATIPDNVFAPDPTDPKVIADQKAAEDKKTREKADYDKKLVDGQKKVDDFMKCFGPWYYVTPGESFRSINLDRVSLVEPKKPPVRKGRSRGRAAGSRGGCRRDFRGCGRRARLVHSELPGAGYKSARTGAGPIHSLKWLVSCGTESVDFHSLQPSGN